MIMVVFWSARSRRTRRTSAGQLRVKGAGWFIKAKDIRFQRQGAGNSHTLLLAAGKLVRVMVFPLRKAHLCQKGTGFFFQFRMNSFAVGFILRFSFASSSPARVMFCKAVYCGKRLKFWNTRPKCRRFCALHFHGGWPGQRHPTGFCRPHGSHRYPAFPKVQAAQQRCFAGAGRTDDGQCFAFSRLRECFAAHGYCQSFC